MATLPAAIRVAPGIERDREALKRSMTVETFRKERGGLPPARDTPLPDDESEELHKVQDRYPVRNPDWQESRP